MVNYYIMQMQRQLIADEEKMVLPGTGNGSAAMRLWADIGRW